MEEIETVDFTVWELREIVERGQPGKSSPYFPAGESRLLGIASSD